MGGGKYQLFCVVLWPDPPNHINNIFVIKSIQKTNLGLVKENLFRKRDEEKSNTVNAGERSIKT